MEFFTSMETLKKRYGMLNAQMRFGGDTPEQFYMWKAELRKELAQLTGLDAMTPCSLRPEITEEVKCDGYTRQKALLQVEPGVIMPMYVLIPDGLKPGEKRAAVIATHGHGSHGKHAVAGVIINEYHEQSVKRANYRYGVEFVKQGFVVFCPDARGFGERRESTMQKVTPERMINCSCSQLNNMGMPLGQTVTGMWTWDLMRLIDYIQTRPEADCERIGCAGLSGGGQQSLWLAAMDDRIKCAVISGYFYGCLESLLVMSGNCSCNYVPHLWEKADMGDIAALIAPRPIVIETGDQDPLNSPKGLENVIPQVEITKKAYKAFAREENVVHDIFQGQHRWNGKVSVPMFQKWLEQE